MFYFYSRSRRYINIYIFFFYLEVLCYFQTIVPRHFSWSGLIEFFRFLRLLWTLYIRIRRHPELRPLKMHFIFNWGKYGKALHFEISRQLGGKWELRFTPRSINWRAIHSLQYIIQCLSNNLTFDKLPCQRILNKFKLSDYRLCIVHYPVCWLLIIGISYEKNCTSPSLLLLHWTFKRSKDCATLTLNQHE